MLPRKYSEFGTSITKLPLIVVGSDLITVVVVQVIVVTVVGKALVVDVAVVDVVNVLVVVVVVVVVVVLVVVVGQTSSCLKFTKAESP